MHWLPLVAATLVDNRTFTSIVEGLNAFASCTAAAGVVGGLIGYASFDPYGERRLPEQVGAGLTVGSVIGALPGVVFAVVVYVDAYRAMPA
jgi:hypothetical protein